MNDDYLWDKCGEPDPEIQELEQILGTLRYQPKELEIPADIRPPRKSYVTRGLAIAAVVALLVLGLGVWQATRRVAKPEVVAEVKPTNVESTVKEPKPESSTGNVEQTKPSDQLESGAAPPRRRSRSAPARNRQLERMPAKLSESEVAEAKAAKDQLILALRVASSKLNQVQKKTQGNNEIHNQHKTG